MMCSYLFISSFSFSALYLTTVSILAGFWGQYFVRKLITILKRASLIVFILSAVIFASALTMGTMKSSRIKVYNLDSSWSEFSYLLKTTTVDSLGSFS